MTEYTEVERPFLEMLNRIGWVVIDQGEAIPQDPAGSRRTSFLDVILEDDFRRSIQKINSSEGELSTDQIDEVIRTITKELAGCSLIEANMNMQQLFRQGIPVAVPGEANRTVQLIDFEDVEANDFLAMNQFRIDTPGGARQFIIPDVVCFVNGLPLVVVEAKRATGNDADPMEEAFEQLQRYSDQRGFGIREGDARLFHPNLLCIRTCGEACDYGSITATERFYYPWRLRRDEEIPDDLLGSEGSRPQEILIYGLLDKHRLLDILRTSTVFQTTEHGVVKIVTRHQQYRAAQAIVEGLRTGTTPEDRSGVIWHTTGSGKSFTMVFAARMLKVDEELRDHKIILVNDRTSLEEQLSNTAQLIGEDAVVIDSTNHMRERLCTETSDVSLVMMHKFQTREGISWDSIANQLDQDILEQLPQEIEEFGTVNESSRILIMIDEAHRTQRSDPTKPSLSDNLFEAFPQATRIGFTGTPLISDPETSEGRTMRRFGGRYIDQYRPRESIEDGATLPITYIGCSTQETLDEELGNDMDAMMAIEYQPLGQETEEELANLDHERELARTRLIERYGNYSAILSSEEWVARVSREIVRHYVNEILPNGFKAQVVAQTKLAAIHFRNYIRQEIALQLAEMEAEQNPDPLVLNRLRILNATAIVSSDGTNEDPRVTIARRENRELNGKANFLRDFDVNDPTSGIGIICVCDMLLTGFDAPVEQVMYFGKRLRTHSLVQAISRVNRVARGKNRGFIVDFAGFSQNLREAMAMYDGDYGDLEGGGLLDFEMELEILRNRHERLVSFFVDDLGIENIAQYISHGETTGEELYTIQETCISLMDDENIQNRVNFKIHFDRFLEAMEVCYNHPESRVYVLSARRFGHILGLVRERYRDRTLNLRRLGRQVQRMINDALLEIEIDLRIPPIDIFSEGFAEHMRRHHREGRPRAMAMIHHLRRVLNENRNLDPELFENLLARLEEAIVQHGEDWNQMQLVLEEIGYEMQQGRPTQDERLNRDSAAIFGIMRQIGFGGEPNPEDHEMIITSSIQIQQYLHDINQLEHVRPRDIRVFIETTLINTENDSLYENRNEIIDQVLNTWEARSRGDD